MSLMKATTEELLALQAAVTCKSSRLAVWWRKRCRVVVVGSWSLLRRGFGLVGWHRVQIFLPAQYNVISASLTPVSFEMWLCHGSGSQSPAFHGGGLISMPDQSGICGEQSGRIMGHVFCVIQFPHVSIIIRRVRKFAKSDCQLRHVRPSARMDQLDSHWTDVVEIWFLCFSENLLSRYNFG
jgi:hypothetical protein